jgi:hypothetical protein
VDGFKLVLLDGLAELFAPPEALPAPLLIPLVPVAPVDEPAPAEPAPAAAPPSWFLRYDAGCLLGPRMAFVFRPIRVSANAPGGPCVLRTFDDVGAFVLADVEATRRKAPHWMAVRQDLIQARFGARCAEVHQAMRDALAAEGWLE